MAKPGQKKGSIPWNYGLTKETDDRVRKYGEKNKGKLGYWTGKKREPQSEEAKKKHSERMIKFYEEHPEARKEKSETFLKYYEEYPAAAEHSKFMKKLYEDPEKKRKQRLATIKRIEDNVKNGGQVIPFYSPEACKLINEYGKLHGYNFQHAENGGEFHIKELGYWVDGYDKEKNVIIEIDEPNHYDFSGNLSKKDVERQTEIENFLKCKFIRVKV